MVNGRMLFTPARARGVAAARTASNAGAGGPGGIDWLSPPALLAAAYIVGFGLNAIDTLFGVMNPTFVAYRLRSVYVFDASLSVWATGYLGLGYALFLLGYRLRLGFRARPGRDVHPRTIVPWIASAVTTIMFVATFGTLVAYTASVGYGRYIAPDNSGQSGLENLALLGELSILPFALGMYRFALWRWTNGAAYMSLFDRVFTWAVMFPLQLGLGVVIGSRSRALGMLLVTVGALHYGYRRLTTRWVLGVVAFCVLVLLPGIGFIRISADDRPDLEAGFLWENVAQRGSSLESFTVIFNNLDLVPIPDPLWQIFATGLVPRAIWPTKPMATTASQFSDWASGYRREGLSPPLPGELLMHFGYVGGLTAMFALGFVWRLIFAGCMGLTSGGGAARFLYLALIPTFLSLDSGFVNPYSVVVRFLAVGVPMLLLCQSPAQLPMPRRSRHSNRSPTPSSRWPTTHDRSLTGPQDGD